MTSERHAASSVAGRHPERAAASVLEQHYVVLFCAVLALAAFNLWFRIGSELVSEWDEALYAITAAEIVRSGDWIGTTFLGNLDYYNSKPPLNVWLIALSFKVFGSHLIALRLVSTISAWLTVAVLMLWTRRVYGTAVSLLSGVVLATCFAFLHEHAGRSANPDALFTLLGLLTVVSLWAAQTRSARHIVWIGPIAAAAFLLRGMGVLMPLVIVAGAMALGWRKGLRGWIRPAAMAFLLFLVPVLTWAVARYRFDGWEFLSRLFWNDFVALSTTPLEGHRHGPLFYLDILQKHHYDWLIAGLAAILLFRPRMARVRELAARWRDGMAGLFLAWAVATLLVPTAMETKLPWYLNSFYPLFAVTIALPLAHAVSRAAASPAWRGRVLLAISIAMFGVAEAKLLWYSYHYRDVSLSGQAAILAHGDRLAGKRLFRDSTRYGGIFVARDIVGAEPSYAADLDHFLSQSRPNDYFLTPKDLTHADIEFIGAAGGYRLYRRCEGEAPRPDRQDGQSH